MIITKKCFTFAQFDCHLSVSIQFAVSLLPVVVSGADSEAVDCYNKEINLIRCDRPLLCYCYGV